MKSVQTALNKISSSSSNDTQSVEAQETSGSVTAVTGEAAGKQIGQQNDGQAAGKEEGQALGETAGGAGDQDADSQDEKDTGKDGGDGEKADEGTNGSDGVYVVEQGDTLAIISRKMYGDVTHVDAICKMNGLTNGNLIYVGQKLVLP